MMCMEENSTYVECSEYAKKKLGHNNHGYACKHDEFVAQATLRLLRVSASSPRLS